jgi:superkiller protein 3
MIRKRLASLAVFLLVSPAWADKKLDEAVAKAEEQLQKNRPDDAEKNLTKFVQSNPSAEAWTALSRFQEKLGKYDDALKSSSQAVSVAAAGAAKADALAAQSSLELVVGTGKDALAHAQEAVNAQAVPASLAALARAQARVGDSAAAVQTAEKALQAGASSALAHEAKGDALLAAGRKDEAVASYRKALELDPKWNRARIGLAAALTAAGKHADAVAEAKKAAEADQKSGEAYGTLGLALLGQDPKNWTAAIAEAQQGAFLNPKSSRVQIAVGRIFEAAGNLDQAAAAYERAIQIDPGLASLRAAVLNMKFPPGRVQKTYREAKEKQPNGGLELSKSILARDEGYQSLVKLAAEQPKNGDLQFQIGQYHLYVEDYKGAAEALKKSTDVSPSFAPGWAYLGTALQFTGRTPEAVVAYKKAVELDAANIPFRSTYGLLLCVNGEADAGAAELVKVTSSPGYKDSAGFTNLGWCYRNANPKKTKESVAAYSKALELDPKNAQAALGMGWAYSYEKSYDQAIQAFQKAAQIDPSLTAEAMNGIAWCYFFKQDMGQAIAHLDKAQAAGRSDPRLRENIAKLEKLKAQRAAYEEALRKAQEERDKGPDVGTLCRQAASADPAAKIRAIRALGNEGAEAVNCLIRPLTDDSSAVREAAAEELGGIGPAAKAAVPYLMEVAKTECAGTIIEQTEKAKAEYLTCEDAKTKARDAIRRIQR